MPPSGENVARPNSALPAATIEGAGTRDAANTALRGVSPSAAASGADERDASGRSSKRNIPEIPKATTATTMASRSIESAGAPGEPGLYEYTVTPVIAV